MSGIRLVALFALLALVALGCNGDEVADDEAAEEIVIGVPTALGTVEGEASLQAVQLAAEEINEAGGVDVGGETAELRVVEADTRGAEPDIPVPDALSSIERLIADEDPDAFIVAPFRSEVILAAMDLIADEEIPTLATIALTPEYQTRIAEDPERFRHLFRVGLNAQYFSMYLSGVLGSVAEQHGLESLQVVHQDVLWAEGTAGFVVGSAEEAGWDVVGTDAFPTGSDDFSSALATSRDEDVDVVMPLFDMPESGAFVRQANSMGVDSLVVGFNSPVAAENATEAFEEADLEGHVNFIFEVGPLVLDELPATREFNEAFGEMFGEEARAGLPGHGPAPSYDSVYLFVEAIERAGSTDADAIAEELQATDYEGVIGRVQFEEGNQATYGMDPGEAALGAFFQWQDGERVPVFPEAIAEAEVRVPGE